MNLIDTHCHLFFKSLKNDLDTVIGEARQTGVSGMVTVGTDIRTSLECIEVAGVYDHVYAAAGVHPHDAGKVEKNYREILKDLADDEHVIALGEMGLDYYRNYSSPDDQTVVFREQLELAKELEIPFIFHNRDADEDILSILNDVDYGNGVAHCFSSDLETARQFIDLGLYISFAGNITYKNSPLPEVARRIPLERLLVETDAPFLSPVPHRGQTNSPARTRLVAEKLSEIRHLSVEDMSQMLTENTERLFGLRFTDSVE